MLYKETNTITNVDMGIIREVETTWELDDKYEPILKAVSNLWALEDSDEINYDVFTDKVSTAMALLGDFITEKRQFKGENIVNQRDMTEEEIKLEQSIKDDFLMLMEEF